MRPAPPAPAEVIPRAVLLCAFEGVPYLLAGLGDGHLFTFVVHPGSGDLTDCKKLSLVGPGILPSIARWFGVNDHTVVMYMVKPTK